MLDRWGGRHKGIVVLRNDWRFIGFSMWLGNVTLTREHTISSSCLFDLLPSGINHCSVLYKSTRDPSDKRQSADNLLLVSKSTVREWRWRLFNPLNPKLNPICYLLALLAHHFLHVCRIRVKSLTFRLLMSYIYIYIYIWSTYSWCF